MKYNQKQNPLWMGILYGTAIYCSIVLSILYIVGVVATILIIPMCIILVFVLILQMRNISSAKKEEDVDYCLKTYFIYKYIMMPVELICAGIVGAFIFGIIKMIIHWPEDRLIATFLVFIITLIVAYVITFIIAIILYIFVVFTLIELPCFISINCVLGITQKKYGMSSVERAIHSLLQMIPVLDIIDGLYISIKYWNRGRVLAIVSAVFTFSVIALVLSIYLTNRFI
ncbi:hypothetical protein J4O15_02205 [Lachnoanaerobaculum sp. Marseille-Q4761]|jgi:hypothetical protein|uniref:hypothetical protein n=1 Tax=Lachnoanaerobaculum sp. Marseille-Q4761 TaxID=2819511 RepID=UPI001AA184C6|nr:hypothetical protein [Lachnoanaerobaculum sp. Marseille-Q4761]MBO1869792.1 hypothetical protein [Lachnoanaerobaculum sp. Marseille-Q4761]